MRSPPNSVSSTDLAVRVSALSKTFYTGFFAPIPIVRRWGFGKLHRVVHAVSEVSFEITRGQVFALLGANGAGKSTTMKTLMGLIRPTQGDASLFGVDVRDARARRAVGYLPENPSFYEELTPRELMKLFCEMREVPRREIKHHIDELLERVGMLYAADRPLRKLSKGMHQRVGIAQALIGAPSLLVLDEPFSGLDPIGRREIREVLLAERDRGATLLFSSHILPDVEALCDQFLVLEQGRVRHQGELAELSLTESEIELSLSRTHAELNEALRALEGAQEAQRGSLTTFYLSSAHSSRALDLISQHHGEVYALQRVRPPLEELFIASTGTAETMNTRGVSDDEISASSRSDEEAV